MTTQTGVRVELAEEGSASVATGLPVLDHLVGELARAGRFRIALEVAPGSADEEVAAAGTAFGQALASLLDADGVAARGWAIVPADEALASAALERTETARFASNVDFSNQRVAGLATDVASRFLQELVKAADLNLHVRLIEGQDPQHVLDGMFKAVGAALGQACRRELQ
jgi:imidazoleglycerol phosphate dehydratase HisB